MSQNANTYTEETLERFTEEYWEKDAIDSQMQFYLGPLGFPCDNPTPLLQIEMEYAKAHGALPAENKEGISTTLVILVGTSIEPLLQAIYAYRPDRLVPVVNRYYGDRDLHGNHQYGDQYWQDILDRINPRNNRIFEHFPEVSQITKDELVEDTPLAVFEYLRKKLRDDLLDKNRRVVVDITGAKKTMVAGAYLLAAYAGAQISYVDFDRWAKKWGKPYGFSCRISDQIPNPLRQWALHDWQRVGTQYRRYNFAAALESLPGGEGTIWEAEEFASRLEKLKQFLKVCDAWEAGDLIKANEEYGELPKDLQSLTPLAVQILNDYWPPLAFRPEVWDASRFLLKPRALVIYAKDELTRASRLANRDARPDNRAAFIRAYAVYETLIKARVLILFESSRTNIEPASDIAEGKRRKIMKMLTSNAGKLIRGECIDGICRTDRCEPDPFRSITSFSLEQISDLAQYRNLYVHSYVPVSGEKVGEAIQLAEEYLNEFREHWGEIIEREFQKEESFEDRQFAAPGWEELTNACGLDELLPVENKKR